MAGALRGQLRPHGGALVRSLNTNTFRWGYYVLIIRKASGGGDSRNVIDDRQWQVSPQACGTRQVQRWKLVPFWEANGKWAGGGWDPGYVYNEHPVLLVALSNTNLGTALFRPTQPNVRPMGKGFLLFSWTMCVSYRNRTAAEGKMRQQQESGKARPAYSRLQHSVHTSISLSACSDTQYLTSFNSQWFAHHVLV